jgi:hypothetical protein
MVRVEVRQLQRGRNHSQLPEQRSDDKSNNPVKHYEFNRPILTWGEQKKASRVEVLCGFFSCVQPRSKVVQRDESKMSE